MSLILNDASPGTWNIPDDGHAEDHRDLARLDYYMTMLEDNKKASRFVPDDALVALDMAGVVREQLRGNVAAVHVSTARLALALVQPYGAPLQ